jgi:serine/threonine protein kinase
MTLSVVLYLLPSEKRKLEQEFNLRLLDWGQSDITSHVPMPVRSTEITNTDELENLPVPAAVDAAVTGASHRPSFTNIWDEEIPFRTPAAIPMYVPPKETNTELTDTDELEVMPVPAAVKPQEDFHNEEIPVPVYQVNAKPRGGCNSTTGDDKEIPILTPTDAGPRRVPSGPSVTNVPEEEIPFWSPIVHRKTWPMDDTDEESEDNAGIISKQDDSEPRPVERNTRDIVRHPLKNLTQEGMTKIWFTDCPGTTTGKKCVVRSTQARRFSHNPTPDESALSKSILDALTQELKITTALSKKKIAPKLYQGQILENTHQLVMVSERYDMNFQEYIAKYIHEDDASKKLFWYPAARTIVKVIIHLATCGIFHADLKPANIVVKDQGDIRLIDFDIRSLSTHRKDEPLLRDLGGNKNQLSALYAASMTQLLSLHFSVMYGETKKKTIKKLHDLFRTTLRFFNNIYIPPEDSMTLDFRFYDVLYRHLKHYKLIKDPLQQRWTLLSKKTYVRIFFRMLSADPYGVKRNPDPHSRPYYKKKEIVAAWIQEASLPPPLDL